MTHCRLVPLNTHLELDLLQRVRVALTPPRWAAARRRPGLRAPAQPSCHRRKPQRHAAGPRPPNVYIDASHPMFRKLLTVRVPAMNSEASRHANLKCFAEPGAPTASLPSWRTALIICLDYEDFAGQTWVPRQVDELPGLRRTASSSWRAWRGHMDFAAFGSSTVRGAARRQRWTTTSSARCCRRRRMMLREVERAGRRERPTRRAPLNDAFSRLIPPVPRCWKRAAASAATRGVWAALRAAGGRSCRQSGAPV